MTVPLKDGCRAAFILTPRGRPEFGGSYPNLSDAWSPVLKQDDFGVSFNFGRAGKHFGF